MQNIVISGGGMVGLSLAIALARLKLDVTVFESGALDAQTLPAFDGRVSAIAYSSRRFFESIGVWDTITPHACPILDIRITNRHSPLFLHFDHRQVGNEPMGHIAENRFIRQALITAAKTYANLQLVEQASYQGDDHDVLVCAEGKFSPLREKMGIETYTHDYAQTAIVCTISHTLPHRNIALESFLSAGPFAVLPMMDGLQSSLVWVEPKERAGFYLTMSEAELAEEITQRIGDHLGEITLAGPRFSYPLSLMHAKRYTARRFCLVGDAAHAIHPVAGQGFNLGLRDAEALTALVKENLGLGLSVGSDILLRHYESRRRANNLAMLAATHGLNSLFSIKAAPIHFARSLGLAATHHLPKIKQFFIRHAMGV